MIFSHLPWWANIIALAVILVVKYAIIQGIERTPAYTNRMGSGKGWMAVNNVVAGLNAAVTLAILFFLCSFFWAFVLAVVDGAIHWLIGYWKVKKMFPKISKGNVQTAIVWWKQAKTWIAGMHLASYIGIASWVVEFVSSHGSNWASVVQFFQ